MQSTAALSSGFRSRNILLKWLLFTVIAPDSARPFEFVPPRLFGWGRSPVRTGSMPTTNTIGIVAVAELAIPAATPLATITFI
jgi:hypothetical protein